MFQPTCESREKFRRNIDWGSREQSTKFGNWRGGGRRDDVDDTFASEAKAPRCQIEVEINLLRADCSADGTADYGPGFSQFWNKL